MKTTWKLLIFLAIVGLLSLVASTLAWPFLGNFGFKFHKVLRRTAVIFGILGAAAFWRFVVKRPLGALGLKTQPGWLRNLLMGAILGIGAILIYVIFAISMKLFKFELHRFNREFLFVALLSIPAAAIIGAIEEFFFRGVILQSLKLDLPGLFSLLATNIFYAFIHIKYPAEFFAAWPKLLGLFILGLALTYGYYRSGSLFLPIGLHAGLVYGIKVRKVLFVDMPGSHEWLLGDKWLVGGVISWAALLFIIFLIRVIPLKKSPDDSLSPMGRACLPAGRG